MEPRLTGGTRQVVYLVGFQHEGHDSGYPDVYTVNREAGGREKLLEVMERAAGLNAVISFHDNYDDAYLDSPMWDPDDISIDRRGELLKGGVWNGSQAYWISLPHYLKSKAVDRIEKTLSLYPLRDTYHLDVLTASVFRVDHRKNDPAGKDDDLAARIALVEEFRRRGIDVTAEACGAPFLDAISHYWHLMRPEAEVYRNDRRIPLIPFVAHGHVTYGGSLVDSRGILDGLLYGAFYSDGVRRATPIETMLDAYYLLFVPLNLLRSRFIEDYRERGTRKRMIYSRDTYVEVDFESLEHEVVVDGYTVVKDFICLAPAVRGNGCIAYVGRKGWTRFYSRPSVRPLPEPLSQCGRLEATALTGGRSFRIEVTGGKIELDLPIGVPHRLVPG